MNASVAQSSVPTHLARLESRPALAAKAELNLLEMEQRAAVGRMVERAFDLAGLSAKEVAGRIDRDQGQISKWVAGTERPMFDLLLSVPELRQPLLIAFAEFLGQAVEIETVVKIRRRVA